MSFNCNRCNEEITEDGTGVDFVAAMPKEYRAEGVKSSISGKLCPDCAALIFGGKDSRKISVTFVNLSPAPARVLADSENTPDGLARQTPNKL